MQRVSAVLRNTREKGWHGRWLERSGRNAEPRIGKERKIECARWETHNIEREDGRCALWIRHYSPRLLLPTYQPSYPGTRTKRVRAIVTRTRFVLKERTLTATRVQRLCGQPGRTGRNMGKVKRKKKSVEPIGIS